MATAPTLATPSPPPTLAAAPPPVVAPPPADLELAAYKQARTAMRTDLAAALAALRAYLAAYPAGRFEAEARLSTIECLVRLGRLADTGPDVDAFLARFPTSERAGEVHFVRAERARTLLHRCDLALADYRAAEASPRVADDALFFRAWCADAVGDRAQRDAAATAYLDRAPAGRHAAAAAALRQR